MSPPSRSLKIQSYPFSSYFLGPVGSSSELLVTANGGWLWIVLQYVSEKIGWAKGTELEDDIIDMEKVIHLLMIISIVVHL